MFNIPCNTLYVLCLQIFQKPPIGVVVLFAGTGVPGSLGDGASALNAQFNAPDGLAVGSDGSVYVADVGNNKIRKIDPSGVVTTVAGTGAPGNSGDNAQATSATLHSPTGVAVGADGSIFIADQGNNKIRKVDPSGVIAVLAGSGAQGCLGDNGPAISAQLNSPTSVSVGPDGSVYIADSSNDEIRKVIPSGTITTIAGTCGTPGSSGDGGQAVLALLNGPTSIAVSSDGSVYIGDKLNNKVRKIDQFGVISTVAGTGEYSFYVF